MFEGADPLEQRAALVPILRSVSVGPDITVDQPMVLIGRHPQCDARLDSKWVSLRHCVLAGDGGDLIVRDLGSTKGTRIEGSRVDGGRFKPGDELMIARIHYRLEGHRNSRRPLPIFRDRDGA